MLVFYPLILLPFFVLKLLYIWIAKDIKIEPPDLKKESIQVSSLFPKFESLYPKKRGKAHIH